MSWPPEQARVVRRGTASGCRPCRRLWTTVDRAVNHWGRGSVGLYGRSAPTISGRPLSKVVELATHRPAFRSTLHFCASLGNLRSLAAVVGSAEARRGKRPERTSHDRYR